MNKPEGVYKSSTVEEFGGGQFGTGDWRVEKARKVGDTTNEGIYDRESGGRLRWRNKEYHWARLRSGNAKGTPVPMKGLGVRRKMSPEERKAAEYDYIFRTAHIESDPHNTDISNVFLGEGDNRELVGRIRQVDKDKNLWSIEKVEKYKGNREKRNWGKEPGVRGIPEAVRLLVKQVWDRRSEQNARQDPARKEKINTVRAQRYQQKLKEQQQSMASAEKGLQTFEFWLRKSNKRYISKEMREVIADCWNCMQ